VSTIARRCIAENVEISRRVYRPGNVDAPLVRAHGGALRHEGVGDGKASHLYGAVGVGGDGRVRI